MYQFLLTTRGYKNESRAIKQATKKAKQGQEAELTEQWKSIYANLSTYLDASFPAIGEKRGSLSSHNVDVRRNRRAIRGDIAWHHRSKENPFQISYS